MPENLTAQSNELSNDSRLIIPGPRIALRLLAHEDLALWLTDADACARQIGLNLDAGTLDEYLRRVFQIKIENIKKDPQRAFWYTYFGIVLQAARTVIGLIGFKGVPNNRQEAEIGYGLNAPYHGQGYATEAVQCLASWTFAHTGLAAMIAETDRENRPSQRVLEKAGFLKINGDPESMFHWRLSR